MGLMDVLNGMQNGPRGQRSPSTGTGAPSGGMSPMTMALLGLLAYKAIKSFSGQPNAGPAAPAGPAGARPASLPGGTSTMGMQNPSGGLSDLLKGGLGGLGGLLAGGAAGGVLSGGLGDLLKQFQDKGHGIVADFLGGYGHQQADIGGGSRHRAGTGPDQHADVALRHVTRRASRWPQPAFAGGRRQIDAQWTRAHRAGSGTPALIAAAIQLHRALRGARGD